MRIRTVMWVLALLACVLPTPARAQLVSGSSLYFDHASADQTFVATYQLCVGPVSPTACQDVGTTRVGTTDALSFTLPAWVPKGRQDLSVRATWKAPLGGASAPTNTLSINVVGGPDRLRVTQTQTPPPP